jgi:hypothetical protein
MAAVDQSAKRLRPHLNDFAAVRRFILRRYGKAPSDHAAASAYDRKTNILLREVYGYVRALLRSNGAAALETYIKNEYGARGCPPSSVFAWGLRLAEPPTPVTNSSRSNYAAELEYAHRHDIHWRVLDCFLAAAGPHKQIRGKLAKLKQIRLIDKRKRRSALTQAEAADLRKLKRETAETWAFGLKEGPQRLISSMNRVGTLEARAAEADAADAAKRLKPSGWHEVVVTAEDGTMVRKERAATPTTFAAARARRASGDLDPVLDGEVAGPNERDHGGEM